MSPPQRQREGRKEITKQVFRTQARESVRLISAEQRAKASDSALSVLLKRREYLEARAVLLYVALKDELDLSELVRRREADRKSFALPRFDPEQGVYMAALVSSWTALVQGQFGILEPPAQAPVMPLNGLDFILVPGLAFDPAGRRLGRGKGFYDRLLAGVTGVKCGVALDSQIVPEIPAEQHDINMDFILTPSRWLVPTQDA